MTSNQSSWNTNKNHANDPNSPSVTSIWRDDGHVHPTIETTDPCPDNEADDDSRDVGMDVVSYSESVMGNLSDLRRYTKPEILETGVSRTAYLRAKS
jgi:hypothetical protein